MTIDINKHIRVGDEVTIRAVVEWISSDGSLHCVRPWSLYGSFYVAADEIAGHRAVLKPGDNVFWPIADERGVVVAIKGDFAFFECTDGVCHTAFIRDLTRVLPTVADSSTDEAPTQPPSLADVAAAAE